MDKFSVMLQDDAELPDLSSLEDDKIIEINIEVSINLVFELCIVKIFYGVKIRMSNRIVGKSTKFKAIENLFLISDILGNL